jgi:hypothetical protein
VNAAERVSAEGRALRPGEFLAVCHVHGHRFTDRAAFEAHMTGEHGAKPRKPGGPIRPTCGNRDVAAPGWRNGKPESPYAWEAPKPARGGLEKVQRDLEAGKYDVTLPWAGGTYRETVRMGEVA